MRRMLIAVTLAALPTALFAASATSTLTVAATVLAGGACTVDTAALYLPDVTPPITGAITAANSFAVNCPNGVPYAIALSAGVSGVYAQRQLFMTGAPTNKMDYNIYTASDYTTVWGDGTGGSAVVNATGLGTAYYHALYGRVPPQATPAPGAYVDTITITATY